MSASGALDIRPARGGGRPPAQISSEVVRELELSDAHLWTDAQGTKPPALKELRTIHHNLARLVAEGKSGVQISALTGFSQSRISILQGDPAFAELVAHYKSEREVAFADVMERAKAVGLLALDEIQSRLESEPANWTPKMLMELVDMMAIRPAIAEKSTHPGSALPAINIGIKFETPQEHSLLSESASGLIEGPTGDVLVVPSPRFVGDDD